MLKQVNLKLLSLALGLSFGVASLMAQDGNWVPSDGAFGVNEIDWQSDINDAACCEKRSTCSPYALKFSYTSPRSIATKHGYETLAAFYCPVEFDCWAPYADVRFHHIDNGQWAGNVGVGIQRRVFSCWFGMSLLRGYVFYDWRDTSRKNFNQVTVGAEWLGERLDVRVNAYLPTEWQGKAHGVRTFHYKGGFFARREHSDLTWREFEINFSKKLGFWNCIDLYLTLGSYYLEGKHNAATGVKFRAETQVWRGLGLAVQTSYDHHFRNRTFAEISWTLPLGRDWSCCSTPCCEPVRREQLIILSKHCHWKTNYNKRGHR